MIWSRNSEVNPLPEKKKVILVNKISVPYPDEL